VTCRVKSILFPQSDPRGKEREWPVASRGAFCFLVLIEIFDMEHFVLFSCFPQQQYVYGEYMEVCMGTLGKSSEIAWDPHNSDRRCNRYTTFSIPLFSSFLYYHVVDQREWTGLKVRTGSRAWHVTEEKTHIRGLSSERDGFNRRRIRRSCYISIH
jgi:hypothetical protein